MKSLSRNEDAQGWVTAKSVGVVLFYDTGILKSFEGLHLIDWTFGLFARVRMLWVNGRILADTEMYTRSDSVSCP